uniref:DUF6273 domain-containing protein n=1 Tax=Ruthenibacterium lactatiformans TaxID=1550024 RepID=UPI00267522D8
PFPLYRLFFCPANRVWGHSADAPPTNANVWNNYNEYDAWAGFLAMLDPKFVAELLTTTQTVARNTVTDGGSYETVTSKMFLPSTTEVGLANENNIAENRHNRKRGYKQ